MEEEKKLTHSQRYPGFGERELLDRLVEQGKMFMVGKRYFFDQEFVKRAAASYPKVTIDEFLKSEGIEPKDFGRFRKRALKIQAEKYSDARLEKLRQNPNVIEGKDGNVSFTLEFRKKLYGKWIESHEMSALYNLAADEGFDVDASLRKMIYGQRSKFEAYGEPKAEWQGIIVKPENPDSISKESTLERIVDAYRENDISDDGGLKEEPTQEQRRYSEDVVRELKGHPAIKSISKDYLVWTKNFKLETYRIWESNGKTPKAIAEYLEENGVGYSAIGFDNSTVLHKSFLKYGEPKWEESKFVFDVVIPEGTKRRSLEELIEDGILKRVNIGGFDYTDDFFKKASDSYPRVSLVQFLVNEGIHPEDLGKERVERLEWILKRNEVARRKTPYISDKARVRYKANPYVKAVRGNVIDLSDLFFEEAKSLLPAPMEVIMWAFEIKHDDFSEWNLAGIRRKLRKWTCKSKDRSSTEASGSDLAYRVTFRKMAVLDTMLEDQFKDLGRKAKAMTRPELKQLGLFIKDRPKDPGNKFTVSYILSLVGISKSSYYNYIGKERYGLTLEQKDELDAKIVRQVFDHRGFKKGVRMVYMLMPRLTGRKMGIDKIRRIMRKYGMDCGVRGPNPARRQAQNYLKSQRKDNILKRKFRLYRPNQVRITDVTYLYYGHDPEADNGKRKAYASALMDPVTNRLIAFNVSESNDLEFVKETLELSKSHPCIDGGIFHSDQGVLYLAPEFQGIVESMGFVQSMSKRGNCWDNAPQESFFGHFKDECEYGRCETIEELRAELAEFQDYYNNERGLWDRKHMTPIEYEEYLLSLTEDEWNGYIERENQRYDKMKKSAAEKAIERYKTLGVED